MANSIQDNSRNTPPVRIKNFTITVATQIFKSFSEESRVRLINLMYIFGEVCITDMEMILDFTQTKTSRHMLYLKHSGIVSSRKRDQWVFYSIKEEFKDIINQIFKYTEKDPQLLEDQELYEDFFAKQELAICKLDQKKWS